MILRLPRFSLVVPLLLAAPLRAQEPAAPPPPSAPERVRPARGWTFGVTGFTRGEYQPGALEGGIVQAIGGGGQTVGAIMRIGSFVQDQAVIVGRTTGFFTGLVIAVRAPLATIAEIGSESRPSFLRFVGAIEGGGQINFASPLPQGTYMATGAALLGFSFSTGAARVDENFAVLVGPAWFVGKATDYHLQATLRYQTPMR